jgi:predicted glycogen debranching enzyme
MDAKVGDWVVTPRRGKAVEINALWYNALRLLEGWVRQFQGDQDARPWPSTPNGHAGPSIDGSGTREGATSTTWSTARGGDDASCRPNQVFAIALDHPVLDEGPLGAGPRRGPPRLLTPVGLRSLASGHPDYKARYDGDLRARDAAYHQGTVWGWLIGRSSTPG